MTKHEIIKRNSRLKDLSIFTRNNIASVMEEYLNEAILRTRADKPLINKVTVTNLDIALRMCSIQIDKPLIDKIIDLVELIEGRGDDVSIKDICGLQEEWNKSYSQMACS
jgi:hypothetical protein